MNENEPKFLTYIRSLFEKNNSDYDTIYKKVDKKHADKLELYSHFYYYI